MRVLLGSVVFAALLVSCIATCQPGLGGRQDYYQCEGLNGLADLQVPPTAKGINIINSTISVIKTDAFRQYSDSLLELNITSSGVEEIQPDAFRNLPKLQTLGLVDNKLHSIDSSWIRGLSNLKALVLYRNSIVDIDPAIYDLLPELQIWDIAYNELNKCLSPDMLKKLKKLRRILIAGNPWSYRCRSAMTWYLGTHHIRFIKDWTISDLLIEECEAHEFGAQTDDDILNKCVDRKIGSSDTLREEVGSLNEQIRELRKKVFDLAADVATLKKSQM